MQNKLEKVPVEIFFQMIDLDWLTHVGTEISLRNVSVTSLGCW